MPGKCIARDSAFMKSDNIRAFCGRFLSKLADHRQVVGFVGILMLELGGCDFYLVHFYKRFKMATFSPAMPARQSKIKVPLALVFTCL